MNNGKFVISLDFELLWGVRDKMTIADYGENIRGVHTVIPRLLKLFSEHQIKGTFSTVGFLFFETKNDLLRNLPEIKPAYTNQKLSPYQDHLEPVGENAAVDPYHYAPQLIKLIQDCPGQEIGTHTFSHYYCLEEGQTKEAFRADLRSASKVAAQYGITLNSLIFPRNQFNSEYLQVCKEEGIQCYRGNEKSWIYKARSGADESVIRRVFRITDAYVNLSGHNCYSDDYMKAATPVNIPSSRFLRPFAAKLSLLENFRMKRIKSCMTYAAKKKLTYHLWWHPHNFGKDQDKNFSFLAAILDHYDQLHHRFGFQSYTMSELASKLLHGG